MINTGFGKLHCTMMKIFKAFDDAKIKFYVLPSEDQPEKGKNQLTLLETMKTKIC